MLASGWSVSRAHALRPSGSLFRNNCQVRRRCVMSVLLATSDGLYLAGDDGTLAPQVPGADFMALARAGRSSTRYYAATMGGQVYRSSAGASGWERVGSVPGYAELSSLAVDPTDDSRLWAGMEPSALFQSRDAGRTWE